MMLFIAGVSAMDQHSWLISCVTSLCMDMLLMPLLTSMLLPVCTLVLLSCVSYGRGTSRRELSRRMTRGLWDEDSKPCMNSVLPMTGDKARKSSNGSWASCCSSVTSAVLAGRAIEDLAQASSRVRKCSIGSLQSVTSASVESGRPTTTSEKGSQGQRRKSVGSEDPKDRSQVYRDSDRGSETGSQAERAASLTAASLADVRVSCASTIEDQKECWQSRASGRGSESDGTADSGSEAPKACAQSRNASLGGGQRRRSSFQFCGPGAAVHLIPPSQPAHPFAAPLGPAPVTLAAHSGVSRQSGTHRMSRLSGVSRLSSISRQSGGSNRFGSEAAPAP
mmetsp:Transcript_19144/g.55590  ORF Transcript_19144/g.55590 Transcript_19144/m.55590 type:complete len:336 (-) Transcript_19144:17-1024(-)